MMRRRLAMAVGDTAGHVVPALAIAEAYKALVDDVEISFLAAGGSASHMVPRAGYPLFQVPASPLARVGPLRKLFGTLAVPRTIWAAHQILRSTQAQLVIGTGGYASGGVLLAARGLGLTTCIVEMNVTAGLANTLLARVVDRHYLAFEEARRTLRAQRALAVGLIVRPSLARRMAPRRAPDSTRPGHLLVIGGSRGDAFLARTIPVVCATLLASGVALEVRHPVASLDAETVRQSYAERAVSASVVPFVDDMADAYAWADVVISRSGAGTLAEIAVAGLPSLLVPLADAAADHQSLNARLFAAQGAAIAIPEAEWEPGSVAAALSSVFHDAARWTAMSAAASRLAAPEAAARVAMDCEQILAHRW